MPRVTFLLIVVASHSIEETLTSNLHKSVCAILCPSCRYLEFPGCGQHKQLLSHKKPNGHGKCGKCPCATDTHGPWDQGCRQCKGVTNKLFWSLSVREAQYLLRAFPPSARRSKDDVVRIKVLSCPCCGVIGFGGLGGDKPMLAVFKDGVDFWLEEGCQIKRSVFEERLGHIGNCPMAGKSVELLEVSLGGAASEEQTAKEDRIDNI